MESLDECFSGLGANSDHWREISRELQNNCFDLEGSGKPIVALFMENLVEGLDAMIKQQINADLKLQLGHQKDNQEKNVILLPPPSQTTIAQKKANPSDYHGKSWQSYIETCGQECIDAINVKYFPMDTSSLARLYYNGSVPCVVTDILLP